VGGWAITKNNSSKAKNPARGRGKIFLAGTQSRSAKNNNNNNNKESPMLRRLQKTDVE